MEFEWDEDKRRANIEKHGIDFFDAAAIWNQPVLDAYANREEAGESRITALGLLPRHEIVVAVVYTVRGARLRLISARRARRYERQDYESAFGRGG